MPAYWQYSPSTATSVLSAVVGATAALTGFVVTASVLAVQMTTGTFSARYMRLWYRSWILKAVLTALIGTLTLSFTLLRHVEADSVPNLGVTMAGLLLFACVLLFVVFFDGFLHRMRPVAVAALVAAAGRKAFEDSVRISADPDAPYLVTEDYPSSEEPVLVARSRQAGSIQAIHGEGLMSFAQQHDCLLVLPHAVGDFVPEGATLIQAYGGGPFEADAEEHLRRASRARDRAHDRAGSGVRDPGDGGHREQGALGRGQRPDDGGSGDRPSRRDPARDRHHQPAPAAPARGAAAGARDHAGAPLGGLPLARNDRDPTLRSGVDAGEPPPPRDARGAPRRGPPGASRRGHGRAGPARCQRGASFRDSPDLDRARTADRQGLGGPS